MEQFKTATEFAVIEESDDFNSALGQRLYTFRTIKKMSRDALGEIMGITGQQVR